MEHLNCQLLEHLIHLPLNGLKDILQGVRWSYHQHIQSTHLYNHMKNHHLHWLEENSGLLLQGLH